MGDRAQSTAGARDREVAWSAAILALAGFLPALLFGAACSDEAAGGGAGEAGGGAAGGDGGLGGAGGGFGGLGPGCIDIFVDIRGLPAWEGATWTGAAWEPGRLWRTERGLHVAWDPDGMRPDDPSINGSFKVLAISTFDPATGATIEHRIYDIFPPETDLLSAGLSGAAGSPDGSFAAYVGQQVAGEYWNYIFLGHLDDPTVRWTWTPNFPGQNSVTHVGWDGEAFAVEMIIDDNVGGSALHVVRLAPDGTVVLPLTRVGVVGPVGEDTSEYRTDAVTGITWVTSMASKGVRITGHYRDGTPLVAGEDGSMVIQAQGVPEHADGWFPSLAPNSDGPLLAFSGLLDQSLLQRVSPELEPAANAVVLPLEAVPGHSSLFDYNKRRIVYHDGAFRLLASNYLNVSLVEIDDQRGVTTRPFVTNSQTRCWNTGTCRSEYDWALDVRAFAHATLGDELWFGFWDLSEQDFTYQEVRNPITSYRIVRVKDGCTYRSAYDVQHGQR